ncbi:major facilitator superfamily domain-containing protein [Mycena pura]|uniref:Major facilitator superfamily domain-containing protein n=1 Tax=Mycena pura TaxID=153505 RepID=A0AAD6V9U3_9AGAR|nr:major facilitator superfamily domain-containing protein [Mycena pura]
MAPQTSVPGLLSAPRITTLLAALLVSVGSGTNYVNLILRLIPNSLIQAYSPQLAERLNINHTQLNVVGLGGNFGVYISGPFWGRIVDSRGPRIPFAFAFVFLFLGYTGLRHFFDAGVPPGSSLSTLGLVLLVACNFMTGAGSNSGFTGAVNSTAKTFPDKARATTTGIVLSGFGLSAFFFSTVARLLFPGDTSSLLLLLSCASLTSVAGFFFVRTVPLAPADSGEHAVATAVAVEAETTIFHHDHDNDSHTPLLDDVTSSSPIDEYVPANARGIELSPPRSLSAARAPSHVRSRSRSKQDAFEGPDVHGLALFVNPDFWLLFVILSLLSGTGLMYINNVGSMAQALYAQGNPVYDELEVLRWQAAQVSTVSIMNCSGRIIIGLISDNIKNRFGFPRSYSLVLVSTLFFCSQLLAAQITVVEDLWKASLLLGLAYGTVFGLAPTVCIEFFGLSHLSENWGFLSLAPLVGGNIFSVAFGRNLDAHQPGESTTSAVATAVATAVPAAAAHQCLEGRGCYVATLGLTGAACFATILLSLLAAWRERRKLLAAGATRSRVVWEDTDD